MSAGIPKFAPETGPQPLALYKGALLLAGEGLQQRWEVWAFYCGSLILHDLPENGINTFKGTSAPAPQ
jgi:hypothetical protein